MHAVQHFLELHLKYMKELRNSKATKKAKKPEIKGWNVDVSNLKETQVSKDKKLAI